MIIWSEKIMYKAVRIKLDKRERIIAEPTESLASSDLPSPRHLLTKEHAPSPIITATARAMTVNGKTTVFAAFPYEPKYEAFAIKIWSTIL